MKESEGYDVGILDSFCRSIAMVIKNDIKDAGFEMENLKFMKKKEVQTIAVETRYPGKNCFVAMFSEPIRDELLKHNDLFQTYSLTVDFKNCVAKTEYRQLA
jgi:ribosome maturation factor RimP